MSQTQALVDFFLKNKNETIPRNELIDFRTEHGRIANFTARIVEVRAILREKGYELVCSE